MKIYVIARGGWDRAGVKLIRAFRTEGAREQWLSKVQCWTAEMLGCEVGTVTMAHEYTKFEVDLVELRRDEMTREANALMIRHHNVMEKISRIEVDLVSLPKED